MNPLAYLFESLTSTSQGETQEERKKLDWPCTLPGESRAGGRWYEVLKEATSFPPAALETRGRRPLRQAVKWPRGECGKVPLGDGEDLFLEKPKIPRPRETA